MNDTVVEKTKGKNPIFHTKLAFLRGFLDTKTLENCIILLRVKYRMQGEHKLKFWLKNINEFQSCCILFPWFYLLPNKNRYFYRNTCAVLKFVNIFEPNLQFIFSLYMSFDP